MKIKFAAVFLIAVFAVAGCNSGLKTGGQIEEQVGEGVPETTTTTPEPTLPETSLPMIRYGLSVTINGIGSVKSNPSGIVCPPDCSKIFDAGTVVNLTAVADSLHRFDGWAVSCAGSAPCNVTMDSDKLVTAKFSEIPVPPAKFRLGVMKAGSGTGMVMSTPTGIGCGANCSAYFDPGTGVDLHAAPDAGFIVGAWSVPSCVGGAPVCHVDMTSNQLVTVAFNAPIGPITYSFTVQIDSVGGGTGTVSVSTLSDCVSASCPYTGVAAGSYVLEAHPASGSTFTGFAGGGCGTAAICTFDLNDTTSGIPISATFTGTPTPSTPRNLNLYITEGEGLVRVERTDITPSPAPFECARAASDPLPKSCNNTYDSGNSVNLTAVPAAGYYFDSWGGDIGTPSVSTYGPVIFDSDKTVKAVFKPLYKFTVKFTGSGGNSVRICPDQICDPSTMVTCRSTVSPCLFEYPAKKFSLAPHALTGYVFNGWNAGVCTEVAMSTCVFSLNESTRDTVIEAKFGTPLTLSPDVLEKPKVPPANIDLMKKPAAPIDIGP